MDNIEWIFSGLGTYILSLFVGFVFGGGTGYFLGVRCKNSQKQKAGDNSNQFQIGQVINHNKQ